MKPRRAASALQHLVLGAAAIVASACDAPAGEEDLDVEQVGGKADGAGAIEEGTAEAQGILRVANESSLAVLDDDVGLDRRAAQGIVDRRAALAGGFQSLAQLDAVPFVGNAAFDKLLAFARDKGFVTTQLKIATFNVRWYGLGGDLFGSIGDETRNATVRAFIDEHLAEHDVIVFEEIVDVDLFTEEVMFDRTCITYEGFTGKHQHVMLCHTDALTFEMESDDDDFALEAINLGKLRPGLHGKLVTSDGRPLAHVVGVHLKAKEDSTSVRLEQAQILSDRLDTLRASGSELPIILIGDFNTHRAGATGLPEDDERLLEDILEAGDRVHRIEHEVTHTYRERDGVGFRLDQAWVSPDITVLDMQVPGPCNLDFETDGDTIIEYYDTVSDHCPVAVTLELP